MIIQRHYENLNIMYEKYNAISVLLYSGLLQHGTVGGEQRKIRSDDFA